LTLLPTVLHAQPADKTKVPEGKAEGQAPAKYPECLDKLIASGTQPKAEDVQPVVPSPPDLAGLDPKTKEKYQAALQRYYEYLFSGFEHRQRVFGWQLLSSKIIFVVVIVLVLVGIYFAVVQFHRRPQRRSAMTGACRGIDISNNGWLYQPTDDGLALELTAKGTKYFKDDDLN
jgi:hypothetical protein